MQEIQNTCQYIPDEHWYETSNGILANKIQQNIKIIYHDEGRLTISMQFA